jgi:aspartate-semialdehyde dehydrogenase
LVFVFAWQTNSRDSTETQQILSCRNSVDHDEVATYRYDRPVPAVVDQINDNADVDDEDNGIADCHAADQLVYFNWKVNSSGDNGGQHSPCAHMP